MRLDCLVFSNPWSRSYIMSDRKTDSGSKSTLEIILEFGHKSILKEKTITVIFYKKTKTRLTEI